MSGTFLHVCSKIAYLNTKGIKEDLIGCFALNRIVKFMCGKRVRFKIEICLTIRQTWLWLDDRPNTSLVF